MPDKQPYFTVDVYGCIDCPYVQGDRCTKAEEAPHQRFIDNVYGITPSCPMWEQRVQQQEKKDG